MKSEHFKDKDGNPAGGTTYGVGYAIGWQHGPLGRGEARKEPNGAFVEEIIEAAIDRLVFYQQSKFTCFANQWAINSLRTALGHLNARTIQRERRQVEGENIV